MPTLDILYQWNLTLCGLLCLASFTEHNVFKIYSCRWYAPHMSCISCFISFLLLDNIPRAWYHTLVIHSSVWWLLGCLPFWAIVNNAAVNSCVQVFCRCVFSSLRYISRRGIAESHDNSLQPFQELSECFPRQLHPFTFPPAVYEGSSCSTSLPTFVIVHLFYYSHSSGSEVVSCFGLQVHF